MRLRPASARSLRTRPRMLANESASVYHESVRRMLPLCSLLFLLALASSAAALPNTLKLHFPRMAVGPTSNVEACYFIRVPLRAEFDVSGYGIRHRGPRGPFAVLHFLVYLYEGDDLAGFTNDANKIVPSRGCQDLGPPDRDHRQLIASGAQTGLRYRFPAGVGLPLTPLPGPSGGVGILLDAEWVNGDNRPHTGSTLFTLQRVKNKELKRRVAPIFARTAERALLVAPGTVRSTDESTAAFGGAPDAWGAGVVTDGAPPAAGGACVFWLTGHMRKRGIYFTVDHQAADGTIRNPPDGPVDRFDPSRGRHLFAAFDFTDPGAFATVSPFAVGPGEKLLYACRDDNGTSNPRRLGCAESDAPPGTPAGTPGGGPAKPCGITALSSPDCPALDAVYPGRTFTGECRPANLVAGPTPDDEACALAGFYYDAAPDGGCDLHSLPPLE